MIFTDTRDYYQVLFKSKSDFDEDITVCVAANSGEEAKSVAKCYLEPWIIDKFNLVSVSFLYTKKTKVVKVYVKNR